MSCIPLQTQQIKSLLKQIRDFKHDLNIVLPAEMCSVSRILVDLVEFVSIPPYLVLGSPPRSIDKEFGEMVTAKYIETLS